MKKFICLLLALCCFTALAACTTSEKDPEETSSVAETQAATEAPTETEKVLVTKPDGYQLFENDAIAFAYPEGWVKTDGSVVILQDSTGTGNNITVAHEAANAFYGTMTMEDFNTQVKPVYEAMGMTISNATLEHVENDHGLKLLVMAFDNTISGTTMRQTQYVVTLGDYTYTVTTTEVAADEEMVQVVLDTLRAK